MAPCWLNLLLSVKLTADAYEKILEIFKKKKTIMNLRDLMLYRELQHFVLVSPAVENVGENCQKYACLVIIVFRLHLIQGN